MAPALRRIPRYARVGPEGDCPRVPSRLTIGCDQTNDQQIVEELLEAHGADGGAGAAVSVSAWEVKVHS